MVYNDEFGKMYESVISDMIIFDCVFICNITDIMIEYYYCEILLIFIV